MNQLQQIKSESINEFGSKWTQERYAKIAEREFWDSEAILIAKYFQPNSQILDLGCGSGRTAIPLSAKGYKVIGVDITPEMITTARQIALAKNLKINYQVGDATNLEFPDDYFDNAIFANNGWVQIPGQENRQKALNEIYRVLKPGGHLILTAHQRYYSGHYLFFWLKQWFKFYLLKPLGLKIPEVEFGDFFFKRPYEEDGVKRRQFIHLTSRQEVEAQLEKAGFKLELRAKMAELAKQDAIKMEASLSKDFNSFKSPIFYICKK